ncbi:MAG: hypothetical protein HeimC3_45030 [Candidatus Heimdallarchaeota archaeon LC_3]|nr:MAG: hypothetical protein HeimC3_45030 [Candidatus Heimdallarchaeota archaeon LC_3]
MKISEFIGGFISGISFLFITLGVIFLTNIQPELILEPSFEDKLYLELWIPYIAAIIAGIGLGFGLKTDESGFSLSFSFDIGEQWPTLIGAMALAVIFGTTFLLLLSGTPQLALFLELIASLLATFGIMVVIVSWETYAY